RNRVRNDAQESGIRSQESGKTKPTARTNGVLVRFRRPSSLTPGSWLLTPGRRAVAQLAEQRSPKPQVERSSRSCPASRDPLPAPHHATPQQGRRGGGATRLATAPSSRY